MALDPRALLNRLRQSPLDDAEAPGRRALDLYLKRRREATELQDLASLIDGSVEARSFLSGVFAGSPYLLSLAERYPAMLQEILREPPENSFAAALSRTGEAVRSASATRDLMAALRQGKAHVALLVALADLGGVWEVEEATARLSDAAGHFVRLATRSLLARAAESGQFRPRDPDDPENGSGLIVLGMGKFGGRELNYSSDIDLIVFFDREAAPLTAQTEAGAFFVRLTRELVRVLQERTADGYVFRTDLRLRPDPGSTQAAISTAAAFNYYESRGQNWERAAFIKARPVAGDLAAGEVFLQGLRPYLWRKYLDYNAIADIHAMKRQIHAAKGHERIAVAGHNLKLGRGGIREIEFFVQSQQLIAGGRQKALRTRRTLEGLDRLAELGWIGEKARSELGEAYRFLRRIEHRLQMAADHQTHSLPSSEAALAHVARFSGYERLADFERDLRRHMQAVEAHYAALFETVPELTPKRVTGNLVFTGDADDPATVETLRKLGFDNPQGVIATIKGWHYGRYRAMRSVRAREILTGFTPALLEAFGETAEPDFALAMFDRFLSELPAALQLFAMLRANPWLLRFVAQIMGSAPRLARILSRRRRLMDAILDPGYLGARPSELELRGLMRRQVFSVSAYEERLNHARIAGQEQAFSIGAGLLSRQYSPGEAGEAYSLLAETVIETLLDAVQAEFGDPQLPAPAVIAMGKLGGREMTASSDLDLIVVYDILPQNAALAPQHYARFTQRLISALSAQTAEGALYAVDMRLRPSGKAGPLAVRADGFLSYQLEQAWTWEHLALTRARVVAGAHHLRKRVSGDIRAVLARPGDRERIAADVRDMRALIAQEKASKDIWDTRNHDGGLVDVEFVAQFLQIAYAAEKPEILSQNTAEALRNLTAAGLLGEGEGRALLRAASLYQDIAQVLRLCVEGRFEPEKAPRDLIGLLLHATGEPDMPRLEARLRETYAETAALFAALIR